MKIRYSILLLVFIACLIGWSLFGRPASQTASGPSAVAVDQTSLPASSDAPEVIAATLQDEKGCLSDAQMEGSPAVLNEARRRDPIDTRGPDIEAFRGVPQTDLEAFALSGDAAAMVVLATRLALDAQDKDPDTAIDVLDNYGPIVWPPQRPEGRKLEQFKQAEHWFYEAALHGRVMALQRYGILRSITAGGPVELGWVSQQEYNSLTTAAKTNLYPGNLFRAVAYDLHPELRD